MNSPVEQFTIKTLFALNLMGFDLSFTNASLFMMVSVVGSASIFFFWLKEKIIGSK
jgi:F-type H+-transporting ATPase subunit a